MWVVVTDRAGSVPLTLLDGVVATPVRVVVGGRETTGYHVDDEHPSTSKIRSWIGKVPRYTVIEDADVAPYERPADQPTSEQVRDLELRRRLYEHAVMMGWSALDLDGTWDGTSVTGKDDRSPRSGLTLIEHMQTRPPSDWGRLSEMGRPPWDSTEWIPPHGQWVAPSFAVRRQVDDEPIAVREEDEQKTVLYDEPLSQSDEDADTVVYSVDQEVQIPDDHDPWQYPVEQLESTRQIIHALAAKRPEGTLLPLGRVNSELVKKGLRRLIEQAQVEWFLSLPPR